MAKRLPLCCEKFLLGPDSLLLSKTGSSYLPVFLVKGCPSCIGCLAFICVKQVDWDTLYLLHTLKCSTTLASIQCHFTCPALFWVHFQMHFWALFRVNFLGILEVKTYVHPLTIGV